MTTPFHPQDIIRRKRDGLPLTPEEIQSFIHHLVHRATPSDTPTDAQTAALLMAIFHHGLSPEELAALTSAMRTSGETLDPAPLASFYIDKHSTGGVGDKTSLLIAPILAAAGLARPTPAGLPGICVPMISGRSLGHTGGTLDKLESIPGFNTQLSLTRLTEILKTCGAALIGQTPNLVPADRILYALRDHTATVEHPDLITASIMSKKLAESLNALVLDVKTGSGAFMRHPAQALALARLMVHTGHAAGCNTVALITNHDQPIGRFVGNSLEVKECVDILTQHRHPLSADLIALTNLLAGWMLHLAGHAATPEAGATLSDAILRSGQAHKAFLAIVQAQGGDIANLSFPAACPTFTLTAQTSGYLTQIDASQVGWAAQRLGAGRTSPNAQIDPHAGLEIHAKLGDHLTADQPFITLYAQHASLFAEPTEMLHRAYTISPHPIPLEPILRQIITAKGPQS